MKGREVYKIYSKILPNLIISNFPKIISIALAIIFFVKYVKKILRI